MNIAYYHASKFGNGALVAEEFKKIMAARGVTGVQRRRLPDRAAAELGRSAEVLSHFQPL
jgi:hypothetical protein